MHAAPSAAAPAALRILEVPAAEVARHPALLDDLFGGRATGAVVRGAFDPAFLATVAARLDGGDCDLDRVPSAHFKGETYGRVLVVTDDLATYLRSAARFAAGAARLFAGGAQFCEHIEALLAPMAGGQRLLVPRGPDGASYLPASIRGVVESGAIDLHCENETVGFPSMRHLAGLFTGTQLSFYLTVAAPPTGGEIVIYDVKCDEGPGKTLLHMGRSDGETRRFLEPYARATVAPAAGDLLVFDAGRHFHRVNPVAGGRTRWTMGGFLARARDGSGIFYWG